MASELTGSLEVEKRDLWKKSPADDKELSAKAVHALIKAVSTSIDEAGIHENNRYNDVDAALKHEVLTTIFPVERSRKQPAELIALDLDAQPLTTLSAIKPVLLKIVEGEMQSATARNDKIHATLNGKQELVFDPNDNANEKYETLLKEAMESGLLAAEQEKSKANRR